MEIKRTRSMWTLALALVVGACATGDPEPGYEGDMTPAEQVTVAVENRNTLDFNVEAIAGGADYRLGTVTTGQTQVYELPSHVTLNDLRLRADPIGSANEFVTRQIPVTAGDQIMLTIEPLVAQSHYEIR
ncbi:MAG: hypothetical protein R3E98_01000 [Gemmatimonadota bacterium]|nr:hypothetical protein [Gemmatimonadota bacterium]